MTPAMENDVNTATMKNPTPFFMNTLKSSEASWLI
jgi:hypothetical protein